MKIEVDVTTIEIALNVAEQLVKIVTERNYKGRMDVTEFQKSMNALNNHIQHLRRLLENQR